MNLDCNEKNPFLLETNFAKVVVSLWNHVANHVHSKHLDPKLCMDSASLTRIAV